MRTMAQKRAEYALKEVLDKTQAMAEKPKKEFKVLSAGAPSMILQNGFGQTLAFWLAKGKPQHLTLFDILMQWLRKTDNDHFGDCRVPKDYILKLSKMEQSQYLAFQRETLALLEWVKRFANADLT